MVRCRQSLHVAPTAYGKAKFNAPSTQSQTTAAWTILLVRLLFIFVLALKMSRETHKCYICTWVHVRSCAGAGEYVYAYVRARGVPWFIDYHSCILHSSFCMHLLLATTLLVCADCTSLCVCVLWQCLSISCQSGTRSRVAVGSDVVQTQPGLS